ncbi:histidinol dehydrogenase [Peloplasma aerotolerans]|uniref:Histidinol dehydrogenase n=1 Tax=Peloplasma aerotolerans TaxID=3044389 RepID=A0AAW6U6N4_9MOLU|nr:histidinol dehydrogenase [Mariniplasma sp. M4Ah]MDI6453623.1 histidinol dehydrogenase [Mariniplasma sp. M4Ah]
MMKIIENDLNQLTKLLNRTQFDLYEVNESVEAILNDIKEYGDLKAFEYTKKFDKADISQFKVSDKEIENAIKNINPLLIEDLKLAYNNIKKFHEIQKVESYTLKDTKNIILTQRMKPIESVGIYIPGGTAAYPSTVLMNAVPAKIAGVKKLVMVTPPNQNGEIKDSLLVAAKLCGVDEIYKIGGAQAIGALTYGTETIPKVDKIVGPGNIYVAIAKKMVSGYVGIDMIAGPSEILIIADEKANPEYIAADLMSQAEHDVMAAAILVTNSNQLARQVVNAIERQIQTLDRKDIIESSLTQFGAIVVTKTIDEAIDIANQIAPEHLEIMVKEPFELIERIENAGAIFIGNYTPEPVGDYFAGPNHTLPTSGTSRFSSALSTTDFMKKTSIVYYSKTALKTSKDSIIRLAVEEGLTAHANSIAIRFEKENQDEG